MKNIGIVGSGNMGRTIGLNWASKGHNIFFGHRRAEILETIKNIAENINLTIQTGTDREAVVNSDIILYCVRNTMPSEIAEKELWKGKIVIDLNNDWDNLDASQSLAIKYQQDIPEALIVKAFNAHAQELFEAEADDLRKANTGSFYCGNDASANQIISELIEDIGLTPVYSGSLTNAGILENMGHIIKFLMRDKGFNISYALAEFKGSNEFKYGGRVASTIK